MKCGSQPKVIRFVVVAAFLLSSNSSNVLGLRPFLPKPYGTATIDYSAINEYYQAHYDSGKYFPSDTRQEPVYNARVGIITDINISSDGERNDASLSTCGFQLVQAPSKVTDWNDKKQLRQIYLAELRSSLSLELGGNDNIEHLEFYHPMLRGEDLTMTTTTNAATDGGHGDQETLQTSPTASMAHIDNDFGAFEAERIVGLVENNSIRHANNDTFPRQALLDAVRQGQRFLVINCWRNVGELPIQRAPLGIYATHYKESNTACFPTSRPDWEHSRWYMFPEMTKDECFLFKQYDRDARSVSDLWHCALHGLSATRMDDNDKSAPLRRSLDIRAFVVLKERVPENYDRYSTDRVRPVLTFQESERFCRAQGVARQQESQT